VGIVLFLSNCTYNDLVSGEKIPPSTVDYMMFGYNGGFCVACGAMYKIIDGKLFGSNHQTFTDPDAVPLTQLPTSSYDLVSSLTTQIPKRIVTGSTSSINNIGTYFPDAGHTYIEVSQNKKVYRWYIEAGNIPADLDTFMNDVSEAMSKLN